MQFEYINPLVGLAMLLIGLFLMMLGFWIYGMAPAVVGIALVLCYYKHLLKMMGTAY